ncbi:MAG TPA: Dyp-type peroxidase [Steroidobacteraceae bacterium]|nr:Dyp-type peroxidase [Steroidobacteraceae bacterium]
MSTDEPKRPGCPHRIERPDCPQPPARPDRRAFLLRTAGVAAAAGTSSVVPAAAAPPAGLAAREPFYGTHQAGIATPAQRHLYFAAFDLKSEARGDLIALLRAWTQAAARLTQGEAAQPFDQSLHSIGATPAADAGGYAGSSAPAAAPAPGGTRSFPAAAPGDTAEALGLAPARLTITVGFGPGLFGEPRQDRYGLAAQRPAALIELPKFPGDQLMPERTGGDIAVQACAEDPQVAFHAVRQLARIAGAVAVIRWVQSGYLSIPPHERTPRNLMGFKDGTSNPQVEDSTTMAQHVWAGKEAPAWMQQGSYLVARRIRIALEHWDRMNVAFQEQTVGRQKYSGAPLGQHREFEPLQLAATDRDGNPIIPENSHVRLAAAASNDGARILRRPYSYNDGVNVTAERWPPWHQGLEYDAGLFFLAYQRDPRTGFVKIYERMSRFDMLNQFVTHVGGGLFACPGGVSRGEYLGQRLFEA